MHIDPEYSVCFTGHRPAALQELGFTERDVEFNIKELLRTAILTMYHTYNIRTFITGGALGVDQWAAEEVHDIRETFSDIKSIIARPFPSQHIKWPPHIQKKFHQLCEAADDIVDVNPDPYAAWKMHARNAWMVNNSSFVIAVHIDGKNTGGTYACLQYAERKNVRIYYIDPMRPGAVRISD
jgi:uncharacterized phage-like protein YoqJ